MFAKVIKEAFQNRKQKPKKTERTVKAGRKCPARSSASAAVGGDRAHQAPPRPPAGLCRVHLQLRKMPARKATSELTLRKPPRRQET